MRRGRILPIRSQADTRAPLPESHEAVRQEEESRQEEPDRPRPATGPGRTRGRLPSQMAALNISGRTRPVSTTATGTSGSAESLVRSAPDSGHHTPARAASPSTTSSSGSDMVHGNPDGTSGSSSRSRRGSDASNSSGISQHFVKIKETTRKVLPKERSAFGQPVQLSINYMTFNTTGGTLVEEYHVDFEPAIESIRLRYTVLRSDVAKETIGNVMHWTGTNLYLPTRLASKCTEFEAAHPAIPGKQVRVKLTWVKTPPDTELLPFYNSLMHKIMNKLKFVVINRQHYSPMHKISIEQHKLEVWPGWVTSIHRLDGGLKLAIDASFKVLRLETVRDVMLAIKERSRVNLKEAFEQELVGNIIMTRYNNRPYRIDGIELGVKPSDKFVQRGSNVEISYADYMKEHWNVVVTDLNQPMIIHCPKPKRGETEVETVYLIPELCVCTGITETMRANYTIMKAVGDFTRLPPQDRENKLKEFLNQLATDERATSIFKDWNLSVKPEIEVVQGRRIEPETIMFGDNRQVRAPDNVDWTRQATGGAVYRSVDINDWVIMYCERDTQIANDLMACIREVIKLLRINVKPPRIIKLPNDSPQTYVNAGKREVRSTDQMVVLVTPGKSQREDRYSACKRLYSTEIPVPCQFIRAGNISNPGKIRSIVQKIVIQVLAKCGGAPWAMKMPMKSFMIVGIDVYHDTIDRKKSCVAFVSSQNDTASKWWSTTFFQESLEEISQRLNATFVSALKRFHQTNGFIPSKVIVYRDGVGDGQIETVINVEVAQVINGIMTYMRDNFEDDQAPQLSYLIVQKRINAKLSLRTGGRILNPLPGTYLDHTITHPEYNDFYLVSQHVNQGTVSPTKYILVTETGQLRLDHHQRLAYKMTYMYYNWCGTIRVPAPCQYAHKLAYLTGQNIRAQASDVLSDKLYYL